MKETKRDSGFAWVILCAAFIHNMLCACVLMSAAVYMVDWVDYFNSTKAEIGLAASILAFNGCGAGLFTGPLIQRFGCKVVTFVGATILSIGLIATSFASSLQWLYVTYSIIAGIGLGLCMTPPMIIVQYYFNKRRALASGISMSGQSIGTFIILPFLRLLSQTYGWKGAVLIQSACVMNIFVAGSFYRTPNLKELSKKANIADNSDKQESNSQNKLSYCFSVVIKFIKNTWDLALFKDAVYVQYTGAVMLTLFSGELMYKFTPLKGISMGLSKVEVALFPSVLGFTSTCARVLTSFIANLECVNRTLMTGVCVLLGSSAVLASTLSWDFISLAVFTGLYGFWLGSFMTLMTTLMVDLMGIARLAHAQSFLIGAMGIVLLITLTLAGFITDKTQNYNIPYYLYGSLAVIGGLLIVTLPITQRLTRRTDKTQQQNDGEKESTVNKQLYNEENMDNKLTEESKAVSMHSLNLPL